MRSQLVVFTVYYWYFLYLNVFSLPDFQLILFPLHFMHSSTWRVSSFPFWTKAIIMPGNPLKFENRAPLLFSLSQNHREVNFCSKIFHDQSHLYPVCMIYENSFVLRLFCYDNLNRTKELNLCYICRRTWRLLQQRWSYFVQGWTLKIHFRMSCSLIHDAGVHPFLKYIYRKMKWNIL